MFLHPLVLLGLAAAAIPALLHLFERRVPPEAEFPPLRYLSEAERRSARRMRLRHLVLLALRTALVAIVVLAAARPLVPTRRPGHAHPPTALVLILDNSLSAGAVAGGQVTLDRLKTSGRAVLRRAAAGDHVWLMLADGIVRGGPRPDLIAAIDSVAVDARRLDLVAAVTRAARLVEAEPAVVREVVVISDLQRTALGVGRARVPPGVQVHALAARSGLENRGIASARVIGEAVTVTLAGTPNAGPVPVTLRVRGRDVSRALAAPGGSVSLPLADRAPGWRAGEVVLAPDELRADDRRGVAWHVVPPARAAPAGDAGPFVAAALTVLREAHRVAAGSDVTIGDQPRGAASIVLPPDDPALVGQVNRALEARGVGWRLAPGAVGSPGLLADSGAFGLDGVAVTRRHRLEGGENGRVLARVNGEPWAVAAGGVVLLASRLDTTWTALPVAPVFVPFVDALVNRLARGEAPQSEREGAPRVEFSVTGADTVGVTVYGPDPRESDLTGAGAGAVRAALSADVLDDADLAAAAFAGLHRADASGALLVLALLVALGELAVATLTR